MDRAAGWRARARGLGHRAAAALAGRRGVWGAVAWPEPRVGGDPARGRQILKGRFRVAAKLIEAPGRSVWDIAPEEPEAAALHGMGWLDDLLALGTAPARRLAQDWVAEWIARFGAGAGPGWTPELATGRLRRLLGHARVLLHPPGVGEERLAQTVAAQARFLSWRWRKTAPGRARIEALAALLEAGLALPGRDRLAARALAALGTEAGSVVSAQGAVASRNPEDLLESLALLVEANAALAAAGRPTDPALAAALSRGAPVLRMMRHADGGLTRFHGGDRGAEGLADLVLAAAGRSSAAILRGGGVPRAMGFVRLAAGRTTVILDAAAPPQGADSVAAHASTLAFELTSGRRPVVVNLGPGKGFGARWRRAARATPSHSTLALEQVSSARLGPLRPGEAGERLVNGPVRVLVETQVSGNGLKVEVAHDGWRASHGLTHARTLQLSPDGRLLRGEDLLTTLTAADGTAFDAALEVSSHLGLAVAVRFHLHPDVEAEPEADGRIGIRLPSGEEWVFAAEEEGDLALEPSIYLEEGRLRPRPSRQIVLGARALRPTTRLRWTLAKGRGTPEGLRDLNPRTDWDEEDDE